MQFRWIGVTVLAFALSVQPLSAQDMAAPRQPPQPASGPGGSEATSHTVLRVKIGDGGEGGWLFLPGDPTPKSAPVVIFCHGWSAMQPRAYQAWIDHLVKRGNIVLWPNYQANLRTPTRMFLPNALAAVKSGLEILGTNPDGIHADLGRMAVAGHSAGGMVAAGIAAEAAAAGLPKMQAVMPVEPGDSRRGGIASVPLADMAQMPADTLLLVLVGEQDTSVGTFDAERILHETTAVPDSRKALLMLHSDDHGVPALVANHFTPTAIVLPNGSYNTQPLRQTAVTRMQDVGIVDALDYNGTWRLLDGLLDAAFANPKHAGFLFDPKLEDMGRWSDGVAITPLTRVK
ncbi:MAG TPA: alpha/beta hydrolase fold domain-containing protein [Acidobacteriaceae bacterium]|nr:alpha/beta hydrolase fold domain-containing protein [Acidobacteriaceae bacterium]